MVMDTSKWKFNWSAIRVKDAQKSLAFYKLLNYELIGKADVKDRTTYIIGMPARASNEHLTQRQGLIELMHVHGSENDPDFKVQSGNDEPYKGFGHFCVSVDNIQAACKRLEDAKVPFKKRLTDGRMRNIAFALDPDGYWIEIVAWNDHTKTEDVKETEVSKYRHNHTMIRVKDKAASLAFYKGVLGMEQTREHNVPEAKFDLVFLAYPSSSTDPAQLAKEKENGAHREALLELTYNYGTEEDPDFHYSTDYKGPVGFAHLAISVPDLKATDKYLREKGVKMVQGHDEGEFKGLIFARDPDGYSVIFLETVAEGRERAKFWDLYTE